VLDSAYANGIIAGLSDRARRNIKYQKLKHENSGLGNAGFNE
jgi:hypothetical protein